MRYRLRTLLIVLALGSPAFLLFGCGSKTKRIQQGIEDVGQHAKEIDEASKNDGANQ